MAKHTNSSRLTRRVIWLISAVLLLLLALVSCGLSGFRSFVSKPAAPASAPSIAETNLADLDVPLRSSSTSAGYIDIAAGKAYAATRDLVPTALFIRDLKTKQNEKFDLPAGIAPFEMAKSGDTLAIGLSTHDVDYTYLQGFDTRKKKVGKTITLPGAVNVMSVAEDTFESKPGNGRFFWAGTYDSSGAKLYRADLRSGKAVLRGSWETPINYIRSMTVSPKGVTLGLASPGKIARIDNPGENAEVQEDMSQQVENTSFPYTMALAQDSSGNEITVVGTEHEAKIILYNAAKHKTISSFTFPELDSVDRVTIDQETHTAWFTTRPFGTLMSLDLNAPQSQPVSHPSPIKDTETTTLSAANGKVWGMTGISELWSFDETSDKVMESEKIIGPADEYTDCKIMSLAQFNNKVYVGGHWRYQVHGTASTMLPISGEPKTQTVYGDKMYVGIYPSGSIYAVNAKNHVTKIMTVTTDNVRASDIEYNPVLGKVLLAIGPPYGSYGGGIAISEPRQDGQSHTYTRPVGDQLVRFMDSYQDGVFIGTSIVGEMRDPKEGESATVALWKPQGDEVTGTTVWSKTIPGAIEVSGIQYIPDSAGGIVLAGASLKDSSYAGWLYAYDAASGVELWRQAVGTYVKTIEEHDGYVSALIDGKYMQLGVTRSQVVITEPAGFVGDANTDSIRASTVVNTHGNKQLLTAAVISSGCDSKVQVKTFDNGRIPYRISGKNRYETAVDVSRNTFSSAKNIVLATGESYPDALSAAPLAANLDAPIILVGKDGHIDDATQKEIARLGANQAVIVGGTASIPDQVQDNLPSGIKVSLRLSGNNRYLTSLEIAKYLEKKTGKVLPSLVVSGKSYADALSAGSAAIKSQKTVILYDGNSQQISDYLKSRQVDGVGGRTVKALKAAGVTTRTELVGADRFDTARLVANTYFKPSDSVFIVNGRNYPDGLTASVAAGRSKAPLLLTDTGSLTKETRETIQSGFGYRKAYLVGGPQILSDNLIAELNVS